MDLYTLAASYVATGDTLAQVTASLYIAIAIFSGEQVATAFKSQQPQIRINPRRYLSYLNLWQASCLLLALPLLGSLYVTDVFPHTTAPALKAVLGAGAFTGILVLLFITIFDTLVHRKIERTYHKVTGSVSRLIAWALDSEKNPDERLKLLVVLLQRSNDQDLEYFMLEQLDACLSDLLKHPSKQRRDSVLGALRTLRSTLDMRPLEDSTYYEALFSLSHKGWQEACQRRQALHAHGVHQLSSTLSGISKELLHVSLGRQEQLAFEYFALLKPFLAQLDDLQDAYFRLIGNDLLQRIVESPQWSFIRDDYLQDWSIAANQPLAAQPPHLQALFRQYLRLYTTTPWTEFRTITEWLLGPLDPELWRQLLTIRLQGAAAVLLLKEHPTDPVEVEKVQRTQDIAAATQLLTPQQAKKALPITRTAELKKLQATLKSLSQS